MGDLIVIGTNCVLIKWDDQQGCATTEQFHCQKGDVLQCGFPTFNHIKLFAACNVA
jgi:hypothetical protein